MRTWLVSILVQLYPRVIDLFSAVLLVDAVQCGEAGEDQSVDQQEKKNMHRHRRFEQFAESAPNGDVSLCRGTTSARDSEALPLYTLYGMAGG